MILLCLIILIPIALIVGVVYLFTTPSPKGYIKLLEKFIGKRKITGDCSVLEYECRNLHPDEPMRLLIKVSDKDFQNIINFISSPKYKNKLLLGRKQPLTNLWIVTNSEFYIDTGVLPNYSEGALKMSITGNNHSKTILFTQVSFV